MSAAMRRFTRLAALSSRSRPVGMAFSRLTRWRSAQDQPPVVRTLPDGAGRSRQAAAVVGTIGPAGRSEPGADWSRPSDADVWGMDSSRCQLGW